MSKYGVFSGPYFAAVGLNTERYRVSLRIQPERRKLLTRKNSVFGPFSRSVNVSYRQYVNRNVHVSYFTIIVVQENTATCVMLNYLCKES